ncbi:MAG: DUF1566 domain-containing protein, partial [Myxococcaceae bacterium]
MNNRFEKIFFLNWLLFNSVNAASLNLTYVTDAQANHAFTQLLTNNSYTTNEQAQLTSLGVRALLAYMAPNIKQLPGYTGLFNANCSLYIDTQIDQVLCDLTPGTSVVLKDSYQQKPGPRLPQEYGLQLIKSGIALINMAVDWTKKQSQQSCQFNVSLFEKLATCTESATKTQESSISDFTTLSDTDSVSLSENPSISKSLTSSKTRTETQSRLSGLLAAWNASTGVYEDATNQIGRYRNSSGVVTDTFTGLQWEQTSSNSTMNCDQAVQYCIAATTGGFHDWRLPNNAELESLVDYTMNYHGPIPGINGIFTGTPTSYFYSSTPLVGSPTRQPWWISFGQTACYSGLLDSLEYTPGCAPSVGYVRCVRLPYHALPAERYRKTTDTVTDTITGLIWQRVSTGGGMTQTNAVTQCNSLSFPNFNSVWRLPTVKELATLVDYSVPYNGLMMDATAFSGEGAFWHWASTPVVGLIASVWVVVFYEGSV